MHGCTEIRQTNHIYAYMLMLSANNMRAIASSAWVYPKFCAKLSNNALYAPRASPLFPDGTQSVYESLMTSLPRSYGLPGVSRPSHILRMWRLSEEDRAITLAGRAYWAVQPPSTGIDVPVTLCASRAQSQSAKAPISDGSEVRREGCFSARRSAIPAALSPPWAAARA